MEITAHGVQLFQRLWLEQTTVKTEKRENGDRGRQPAPEKYIMLKTDPKDKKWSNWNDAVA